MKSATIAPELIERIAEADDLSFGAAGARAANTRVQAQDWRVREGLRRGRGAALNPAGRFEAQEIEAFDDGWWQEDPPALKTTVMMEAARSIIAKNTSPDQPFDRSINPYRGCEHGCIYCYARPSHAHIGLSSGLDFETKLFAKPNAAALLAKELSRPNYRPKPIFIGTNTDPYQPIDKQFGLMREILEVLEAAKHPVEIITKSALILRDIDILVKMAEKNLVRVALSMTTLDTKLARAMEPRAATPPRRLKAVQQLALANIPVSVMVAPIIPGLTDHEMERILTQAAESGATHADYILLRLPLEVAPLFKDWLLREYPDHYRRVFSLLRSMRGGKDYDSEWHSRFRGVGPFADLLARRFELAVKRLNLNPPRPALSLEHFAPPQPPRPQSAQLSLF